MILAELEEQQNPDNDKMQKKENPFEKFRKQKKNQPSVTDIPR